jgi:hypothetical protein
MIPATIRGLISRRVKTVVASEVKRAIPQIVDEYLSQRLLNDVSGKQLSEVGFLWALVLNFEKHWPGIDRPSSVSCAKDCLEVPYGTQGYDWSAQAAAELVKEYVSEHGEVS